MDEIDTWMAEPWAVATASVRCGVLGTTPNMNVPATHYRQVCRSTRTRDSILYFQASLYQGTVLVLKVTDTIGT